MRKACRPCAEAFTTTGNPENKSVQYPSSSNNDTLKIATVVQQTMTKLSEAVSERDKVIVITKIILNETKWLPEFIG
jgi:hypothetical protein